MIVLLLPLRLLDDGGGAPAPVFARARQRLVQAFTVQQAFAAVVDCRQEFSAGTVGAEEVFEVFSAAQTFESVYSVRQVVRSVHTVSQEFEVKP